MDLAVYISELLGLHGEVNVPGVGHFAQIRVDGYYDAAEKKFFPPSHKINFDPKLSEDEALAKYISDKKNISQLSARYFIDKYAGSLKQQVTSEKVEIAGLGYLYSENSVIAFKADNTSRENTPSFYGFAPVKVYKAGDQQPVEQPEAVEEVQITEVPPVQEEVPVTADPVELLTDKAVTEPEIFVPTVIPPEEEKEEEYTYDDTEEKRPSKIWIVVLLVVAIILLSLIAIDQFYPNIFDNLKNNQEKPIAATSLTGKPAATPAVTPQDSTVKAAPAQTTSPKTIAPAQTAVKAPATHQPNTVNSIADTNKRAHYEILGGAFGKLSEAEKVVGNYKKMGFDARILDNVPGKLRKTTLGTYYNPADAIAAKNKILSTKKINKNTIYIQYYKPKK